MYWLETKERDYMSVFTYDLKNKSEKRRTFVNSVKIQ